MSLEQLAAKLRQVRSEMPHRTSEQAYEQMERLMGKTKTLNAPKENGRHSFSGQKTKG